MPATVTFSVKLAAPTNLTGTYAAGKATLGWADNSQREEGFTVYREVRSKGRVSLNKIADVGAGVTIYTEPMTTSSIYQVQAFNRTIGATSDYSNQVTVNPPKGRK